MPERLPASITPILPSMACQKINIGPTSCSVSFGCAQFTTFPAKVLINQTHFLTRVGVNNNLSGNLVGKNSQTNSTRPQGRRSHNNERSISGCAGWRHFHFQHRQRATPVRIYKLTKPLTDQAVIVNLGYDQKVKIDFSAIANEKITLVHVGEKLIILFDNQSTVTVEPFFESRTDPRRTSRLKWRLGATSRSPSSQPVSNHHRCFGVAGVRRRRRTATRRRAVQTSAHFRLTRWTLCPSMNWPRRKNCRTLLSRYRPVAMSSRTRNARTSCRRRLTGSISPRRSCRGRSRMWRGTQLHDHGCEHRQHDADRGERDRSVCGCAARIVRIADVVGDNDGLLEVGETWALHGGAHRDAGRDRQQRRRRRRRWRTRRRPTAARPVRTPTTPRCRWS